MTEENIEATTPTLDNILEGDDSTGDEAQTSTDEDKAKGEPETANADPASEPPADKEGQEAKTVPMAALKDERQKRQSSEEKLTALEAEIAELKKGKAPEAKEPAKRPDVFDDPDGAFQHTETEFSKELLKTKINLSREMMLESKPDYEAMEKIFIELATSNPALAMEMNANPNPAKFAYSKAKEQQEFIEFQEWKKSGKPAPTVETEEADEEAAEPTPDEKRKALALKSPDLTKATSAETGGTKVRALKSLDDILP